MKKLKFLLSTTAEIPHNYADAIVGIGGMAKAEYCPQVDLSCDGLVLCGGDDVSPSYFGEENTASCDIDLRRDEAEFALVEAFISAGKPILGICRGCQLLNIFFGGSIYQDLSNAEEHTSFTDGLDLVHKVSSEKGSFIKRLYGESFYVNSHHHQAVKQLGKGIRISAKCKNVIEGIEHEALPIIAVQWHPERMCFGKKRTDTVDGRAVFEYFAEMCEKRAQN